ncbi:hypothetical protein [Myxococcus phage Mx1]|nr:hypothetical protein [Myxococcus phage Mx1]
MLLIGSKALEFQNSFLLARKPGDLDVICYMDEYKAWVEENRSDVTSLLPMGQGKKMVAHMKSGLHIEFEIAWYGSTAEELLLLHKHDLSHQGYVAPLGIVQIASKEALLALKLSHRYLKDSPAFEKTMQDIRRMQFFGIHVSDRYTGWLKRREAETYTYKHPSLQKSKQDFFSGDGVTYVYDHDSIHRAMAHLERPAYTYFQKDGADVAVDREKWNALPEKTKLYSVVEESYVLALERSQIPFRGKVDPKASFLKALEKVCTSITSGWWREYAWNNYYDARMLYNHSYVEHFWRAVECGIVVPHKGA